MVWSCQGASPSSVSPNSFVAPGISATFCSGDNAVTPAPSSEIRPEKNPFSQARCSSENGAVSEKLVFEAAKEAYAKSFSHLYVIGFAIQPNARELVEKCEQVVGVAATYVQATPDLMMGDLLRHMRSSQIFSVCGLPEIELRRVAPEVEGGPPRYQVKLLGLDVFDPATMDHFDTLFKQADLALYRAKHQGRYRVAS